MAPRRRPGSSPALTIEVSPAYELLQSIVAALDDDEAETYEIGAEWINEVRSRAGDELIGRIRSVSHDNADTFIHLVSLVYDTPAPRDVDAFLTHLRETDADEIKLHVVQFYALSLIHI